MRPLFNNRIYRARRGLAKGLLRKGGLGFLPFGAPSREEAFLSHFKLTGMAVYDVGGWEGIFTLFFSRAVGPQGRVLTFEPNPLNYGRIKDNLALNGISNVQTFPIALGRLQEKRLLSVHQPESGTGSLSTVAHAESSSRRDLQTFAVNVSSLDYFITSTHCPKPDFIKIDVEGAELDVLSGMSQTVVEWHPQLFLEVHGFDSQEKLARDVMCWLHQHSYSTYHVELGRLLKLDEAQLARGCHLYCH